MRYVDISKLADKIPQEWLDKSKRLTELLEKCSCDDVRKDELKKEKCSDHWSKIKSLLLDLSYNKCWYSDAKEIFSDYHIDHFRPKNGVEEDASHPGYWWLAFEWKNYRISASVGNRIKRMSFPLETGSIRSYYQNRDQYVDELPLLIDPTNIHDVLLMTYTIDGRIAATEDKEITMERVKTTVDILCLEKYSPLKNARINMYSKCEDKIYEWISWESQATTVTGRAVLKRITNELMEMCHDDAELSCVARACVEQKIPHIARIIFR